MAQDIQRINPAQLGDPSSYGFTNVVIVPANQALIYIAGQGGRDEAGIIAADFAIQLNQAFINLRIALEAAGATPGQVVKITVLSVEHNAEKQKLISAARNAMWPSDIKPASTLIPVPRLAEADMLFEIDAIAVLKANFE